MDSLASAIRNAKPLSSFYQNRERVEHRQVIIRHWSRMRLSRWLYPSASLPGGSFGAKTGLTDCLVEQLEQLSVELFRRGHDESRVVQTEGAAVDIGDHAPCLLDK